MARGIWSGAISFGLINIPVQIMSAKEQEHLHFRMLDKNDFSPIGYKQINKSTGREVQKKNIVKGYEYQPSQYVVLTEADFKKANPKATQTLDIEDFVDLDEMDPLLFERPYYLVPGKNGEKGYVLLRKTLEKTKKVAISQFVLRTRQYLGAIMARDEYLILEVLRYAHEIKEVSEAKYLDDIDLGKVRISEKEIKMAEQLVKGMSAAWKPDQYKDTYQDDLLKRIQQKLKGGETETAPESDEIEVTNTNTIDLMPLLAKSLKSKGGSRSSSARSVAASRRVSSRTKTKSLRPARKKTAKKTAKKMAKTAKKTKSASVRKRKAKK